jgi:HlyD family secretion protein
VQAQSRIKALIERLRGDTMPDGIVKTNGRIEATQVDVSSKYAGRLAEVTVKEGDEVTAGQVIARIASPEYEAQLRSAQAQVLRARQALAEAEALIAQRKSDQILARTDAERGKELVAKGYLSKQVDDQRSAKADAADAALRAAQAQRDQAQFAIHASRPMPSRSRRSWSISCCSRRAAACPVSARPTGEVVAAGTRRHDPRPLGRLHDDLSAGRAGGQLALGDEARIILDPVPQYVIPATVSFVAADAQFTPKAVETAEEREKLVFRAKLQVDRTCSRNIIGR